MSAQEPGFAFIRAEEIEAINMLDPRLRGTVAWVWIAIRSTYSEHKPFAVGSRDFKARGIGREAATNALAALINIGLLRLVREGGFTGRGHRAVYEIVHTRSGAAPEKTVGSPDTPKTETAGSPANNGRVARPFTKKTVGSPAETAGSPGTILGEGLPSSLRSEGREEGRTAAVPAPSPAKPSPGRREGEENPDPCQALKVALRRIEAASVAIGLPDRVFLDLAGGREAADFLARKFERGELSADQLRDALAGPHPVPASEPGSTLEAVGA